jgi:hypothetical protein
MLICPFCSTEVKTLLGLQKHIKVHTREGYCPVCREYFKNLIHHLAMNSEKDDLHLILYATLGKINARNSSKLRNLRDKAMEILDDLENLRESEIRGFKNQEVSR